MPFNNVYASYIGMLHKSDTRSNVAMQFILRHYQPGFRYRFIRFHRTYALISEDPRALNG